MDNSRQQRQQRERPPLAVVRPAPDPALIEQLEELLVAARRGKLRGLLAAAHYGGGDFHYLGSGSLCADASAGRAALDRLQKKMLHPQRDVV